MRYLRKTSLAIGYWLIWLLLFELARLAFILYNHDLSASTPVSTLMAAFWYGSRMDMATASYMLVPFCLLLLLSCFFKPFHNIRPFRMYTVTLLIPVIMITVSDMPTFASWGYRLDSTPLKYLNHPTEAWASVGNLPLGYLFLGMILAYLIISALLLRFLKKNEQTLVQSGESKWQEFLILLLFTIGQIIPIRGGVQLAPLNQSSVYFSQYNFANMAALNATWNFMRSVSDEENMNSNPFEYLDRSVMEQCWNDLKKGNTESLSNAYSKVPHPNIILITWESLTSKGLNRVHGGVKVLPCLERTMTEGVYFENAFASGDRTDKGIVAILSGYPAQPITSIVKIPEKTRTLPCLPKLLKTSGYNSAFYYGGETEFANMKTYLLGAGFDKITDVNAFDKKDRNSKWGAHDHVVKDRIMQDMSQMSQPFFLHWLTLSSHEPFETGTTATIQGNDDLSMFMNSLHYTDSVLDRFIDHCSLQPWWDKTIVVISGDHGHRLPSTGKKQDDFRTPILLLGGALKSSPDRIQRVVSQTGIAAAICDLTGTKADFPFGTSILSTPNIPYAYFCFNNGFGYTQLDGYFIYDNVGRRMIEQSGHVDSSMLRRGMALQQKSFGDFLGR